MRIQHTTILSRYIFKFIIRLVIFGGIFALYLTGKDNFMEFFNMQLLPLPAFMGTGISVLHVLWLIFMTMMIIHLIPPRVFTMALLRRKKDRLQRVKDYSRQELLEYVADANAKAWKVMLVWIILNAVVGFLYLFNVLDQADLLMITVFYFLCDYICILLYCPFQSKIMGNKCCVNCRIYDWGHFMMFTPMLFIQNFYSWSLFFTSFLVLLKWEMTYAKHPERFWEGSNKVLKCSNCKDKSCQLKKALKADAR